MMFVYGNNRGQIIRKCFFFCFSRYLKFKFWRENFSAEKLFQEIYRVEMMILRKKSIQLIKQNEISNT